MDNNSTLFSIGHGQKTEQEFLSELQSFNIQYLIDVRTSPFSKWASQFNKGIIEIWLSQAGIKYVYMGDTIGGRPLNESCYDDEGYFDYKKMAEEPAFQMGLQRLIKANANHCRVAVMCSESDPSECHRSKLIGRELFFNHDISMNHIIGENKIESQRNIMKKLTGNKWPAQPCLPFGDEEACNEPEQPYFRSRKSYKKVSEPTPENFQIYG